MSDYTKVLIWLLLLIGSSLCFGSDSDVQCLKSVQQSLIDASDILKSSWIFDNNDTKHICRFVGVDCWSWARDNMVLSLRLVNLGLQGQFPKGFENCKGIKVLDLSYNNFSGPIPSDIGRTMPYLISLDLSHNSFSGEMPESIAGMAYLNVFNLQRNQLSGQIPRQFSGLSQLTTFDVADNLLSGPIPTFPEELNSPLNFAGNQGLCGDPLDECPRRTTKPTRIRPYRINDDSSIGAAVGFVAGFVVAFYFRTASSTPRGSVPTSSAYLFR